MLIFVSPGAHFRASFSCPAGFGCLRGAYWWRREPPCVRFHSRGREYVKRRGFCCFFCWTRGGIKHDGFANLLVGVVDGVHGHVSVAPRRVRCPGRGRTARLFGGVAIWSGPAVVFEVRCKRCLGTPWHIISCLRVLGSRAGGSNSPDRASKASVWWCFRW